MPLPRKQPPFADRTVFCKREPGQPGGIYDDRGRGQDSPTAHCAFCVPLVYFLQEPSGSSVSGERTGEAPMLTVFFTIVYDLVFLFLIDLAFKHTVNALTDIAVVVCWVIAFLVSVGLAQYTVRKIKEKYGGK